MCSRDDILIDPYDKNNIFRLTSDLYKKIYGRTCSTLHIYADHSYDLVFHIGDEMYVLDFKKLIDDYGIKTELDDTTRP